MIPAFFLLPVGQMIEEETGSITKGIIVYWLLFFIDITLAELLAKIIYP